MATKEIGKPKLLSKRELELQEVKYIYSLRAERDELQEQLNTAKKALTEIAGGHTVEDAIFNYQLIASKALAAIGGDK